MAAESSGKGKQKGTTLDTSRIKIVIDEYDGCNKKLEEIANFLREGFRGVFDGVKRILENTDSSVEWDDDVCDDDEHGFQIRFNPEDQFSCLGDYQYEIVPEYVACKALDLLKSFIEADCAGGGEDWEDPDWRIIVGNWGERGDFVLVIDKVTGALPWEGKRMVRISFWAESDIWIHKVTDYEQSRLEVSAQIEAFSKMLYKMILT